MRLVSAELLKIRTTSTWWIFTLIMLPLWVAALLYNWGTMSIATGLTGGQVPPDQADAISATISPLNIATTIYTSGQFFGVLLAMVLGAIIVTNEFQHQTATTTFLTTPHRSAVVFAKLAAAVALGLLFWLITTVLNVIAGPFVLRNLDIGVQLGEPGVWRAAGLNALAFVLFAVIGVGVGVLIRSQLGATLTLAIGYLIGSIGGSIVFALLTEYVAKFFEKLSVIVPTTASQLMVAGVEVPGNPPRWVGAVVLIGYAVITGLIGTLIMRRRDIS